MAYWEFLLQKEGDRDWLPLETAHVEISEGRYRIIAHTSFRETAVEIQLTQRSAPRAKTLKRLGLTSDNGLMVVIPFTHLTPGSWMLNCTAIVVGAPAPLEYGVQLQVLEIESGMGYWESEPASAESPETQPTQVHSPLPIHEPVVALPEVPIASGSPSPVPEATGHPVALSTLRADLDALTIPMVEDVPLRLQLQHQALVAQPQTDLYLEGQVTSFSTVEGLPKEGTFLWQLRDPENGTVVAQAARSHTLSPLPSRFTLPLDLPSGLSTRLLVGELSLWTAADPAQILAIQGFSITLNLDALLELVANRAEASPEDVFAPASETETAEADDSSPPTSVPLLSPLSPRQIPFRLVYLPTSGLTLPPLIYRPIDQPRVASVSLPPLAGQRSRPTPSDGPVESPPRPSKPLTLPPIGSAARSLASDMPSPPPVDATPAEGTEVSARSTFQPDVTGRFWERLSALAEAEQRAAAEQKAQMEAAGVETTADAASPENSWFTFPLGEEPDSPPNYEVVIYEPEPPEADAVVTPVTDAASQYSVDVLPPDVDTWDSPSVVPVPTLILPEGELIAGTPLPISVRLPQYPRRLTVKVWVTDVQSRTLVDRPRWLMNWTPTETGEQTAFLQLQVPMGCLESKFEAIAIDLATQQESYKVSQVRSILPPDLPPAVLPPL